MYCNNCGTNIGNLKFCPACSSEANVNESNQNTERILEDLTLNDVYFSKEDFSYTADGATFNYDNSDCNFIVKKKSPYLKYFPVIFLVSFFVLPVLSFLIASNNQKLSWIFEIFNCVYPIFLFGLFFIFGIFVFLQFLNREHLTISVTQNEVNVYNDKGENFISLSKDDIYQFYFVKKSYRNSSRSSSKFTYYYKLFIKTTHDVLIGKEKNKSTNKIDLGIMEFEPKKVRFLEQEFEKILGIPDRPVEDEFEFLKKQYTTIKNNLNGESLPKPEFTKNLFILKDDDQGFLLKREFNFFFFKKISSFLVESRILKISNSSVIGKNPNKEKQINLDLEAYTSVEEQEIDGKTMYYYQNKESGYYSSGFSTGGDPAFVRIYCVKMYPNSNRFDYIVLMHSLTFEEAEYISFRINRLLERNR